MTIRIALAAPFKHTRKSGMRKNELVYYYALDRKWMSTEQANLLLRRAEEEGLIRQDNGVFSPVFNLSEVQIPIGFKPTSAIFEQNDPTQELIRRIVHAQNIQETEVVAEMNRIIKENFDGNLLPAAALILIAQKNHVPFEDLHEALLQSVSRG
ncbi:MAG: DUF2240 family protein [Methanoregula sp.]